MLLIVSVILFSLVASTIVVLMYRLVLNLHRYTQSQVDVPRSISWMKLATPQGFYSFLSAPKERVIATKLRSSKNETKAPWGW